MSPVALGPVANGRERGAAGWVRRVATGSFGPAGTVPHGRETRHIGSSDGDTGPPMVEPQDGSGKAVGGTGGQWGTAGGFFPYIARAGAP